jgi:type IX secretion system PorP/SprF family membrane protein
MKKKKIIFLVILLLAVNARLFAQDFHLSQYDMATLYMNPAMTGMYGTDKADYRFYNDYRSQWGSLTQPFASEYLAYDMPIRSHGKIFGVGAYLDDNSGPAGSFNTMNFMISGAYSIINKAASKHYLTTGLQVGILYKNFNPNSFTFDNQYSASEGGFDQNIPSNETFAHTSLVRFDANYGLYYKFIDEDKKVHPFASFSIQHLTMPNESFTTTRDQLPMRFNFMGGCEFIVNERLKLDPRFLYMNEAKASEINAGLLAFYRIGTTSVETMLGGDFRYQDAIVIHIGLKVADDIFRFSYDVNTSYLNAFSGGRGAWELSLIITGVKGKPLFSKAMLHPSKF